MLQALKESESNHNLLKLSFGGTCKWKETFLPFSKIITRLIFAIMCICCSLIYKLKLVNKLQHRVSWGRNDPRRIRTSRCLQGQQGKGEWQCPISIFPSISELALWKCRIAFETHLPLQLQDALSKMSCNFNICQKAISNAINIRFNLAYQSDLRIPVKIWKKTEKTMLRYNV